MSKIYLVVYFLLLALGQNCNAASIYSFSGQIESIMGFSGTPANTYASDGVFNGAAVNFVISLDGSHVTTDGSNDVGNKVWFGGAQLVASSVDFSHSINQPSYQLYDQTQHSRLTYSFYRGVINVGSGLGIEKTAPFEDGSAFVENWSVGESLSFHIAFDNGSGMVYSTGHVTLTNISNPLPVISTASSVPVPGAAWLFSSGLLGLRGLARQRKAT